MELAELPKSSPRDVADALLRSSKSADYRPTALTSSLLGVYTQGRPLFTYIYAEWMRTDPQVDFCLRVLKGPLNSVHWEIETPSPWAKRFIDDQLTSWWLEYSQAVFDSVYVYGYAPGEFLCTEEKGRIVWDSYVDFYPPDCIGMLHAAGPRKNRLAGLRVTPINETLLFPQGSWIAPEARYQRHYGIPRLRGAFDPFMEKNGKSGALDSRRLWFKKFATRGIAVRYPAGSTNIGSKDLPKVVSNDVLARQTAEWWESGSSIPLLNTRDDQGNPLWEVIDPASFPDNAKIAEYPQLCDEEISKGMGIPKEIYEASTSGSGYSGRIVPLTVYLASLDHLVSKVIMTIARQQIEPLLFANCGKKIPFTINPKRLVDMFLFQQQQGDGKTSGAVGSQQQPGAETAGSSAAGQQPEIQSPPSGSGFTGITQNGHQYVNGHQVKRNGSAALGFDPVKDFLLQSEPWRYGWRREGGKWIRLAMSADDAGAGAESEGPDDDEQRALAEMYAAHWNAMAGVGSQPAEDEIAAAKEDLAAGKWCICKDGDTFTVMPVGRDRDADRVQLSFHKAPAGGVTIGGKQYRGGQFIPAGDYAKADEATKEKIDKPKAEGKAKLASRGDVDLAGLKESLKGHAGKHQLTAAEMNRARLSYNGLKRHHGELAAHRVAMLAENAQRELTKVPEEQEGVRAALERQLAGYHAILHRAEADGLTGKVGSEPAAVQPTSAPAPASRPDGTPLAPHVSDVHKLPPSLFKTDPTRFQYKVSGVRQDGVTDEFRGTKKWDEVMGGALAVWRDPADGKDYVVNGHHRHELATRLGAENINVRYINAANAKEARAIGALNNIADGKGTATDAAKYLRDSGQTIEHLENSGVSLGGKVTAAALQLKGLSDKAFDDLTQEKIDEPTAVAVAKRLKDHALQDMLFKKLDARQEEGKDWSQKEIETAAKKMSNAGKAVDKGTNLFGDFEDEKSTFDQEVELESHISKMLNQKVNDYSAVANAKRADRVADAGNTLAVDENARRRDEAAGHAEAFEREAALKSPVSEAIKKGAEELFNAKTKKDREDVKRRTAEAVHAIIGGGKPAEQPAAPEVPVAPLPGGSGQSGSGTPGTGEVPAGAGAVAEPVKALPAKLHHDPDLHEAAILDAAAEYRRDNMTSLAPIHAVRDAVEQKYGPEAASHEHFDEAALRLWRKKQQRLLSIPDKGAAEPHQLRKSIAGVGETLFHFDDPNNDAMGGDYNHMLAKKIDAGQKAKLRQIEISVQAAKPAEEQPKYGSQKTDDAPASVQPATGGAKGEAIMPKPASDRLTQAVALAKSHYERATDPTLTAEQIHADLDKMKDMPAADLKQVAKAVGITRAFPSKAALHEAIVRQVADRKGIHERALNAQEKTGEADEYHAAQKAAGPPKTTKPKAADPAEVGPKFKAIMDRIGHPDTSAAQVADALDGLDGMSRSQLAEVAKHAGMERAIGGAKNTNAARADLKKLAYDLWGRAKRDQEDTGKLKGGKHEKAFEGIERLRAHVESPKAAQADLRQKADDSPVAGTGAVGGPVKAAGGIRAQEPGSGNTGSAHRINSAPTPEHRAAAEKWAAASPGLSAHVASEYAEHLSHALGALPAGGIGKHAAESLKHGGVKFHSDLKTLRSEAQRLGGKGAAGVVGFAHDRGMGTDLHLDGGDDPRGTYVHELWHAADNGSFYSDQPGWQAAYKKDILKGRHLLSRYALTNASEGFAEFGRALAEKGEAHMAEHFPNATKHLKSKGLI